MASTDEAQGALCRMMISASSNFSSGVWVGFLSETVVENESRINSAGIRGTRTHCSERTRKGPTRPAGTINFEASRILLDNILPAALGAAESSNVFNPAETIPDIYFLIDKGSDIISINEAKIGRLTISAEQNGVVQVSIDIEAESISVGQSWPEAVYPERSIPYLFSDLGDVTVASTAREPTAFSVTIDNVLDADTFLNSRYRDETISATDRIVTASITVLSETVNDDLRDIAAAGAAVSIVLTHAEEASSVLTIALGRVAWNGAIPQIAGKGTQTFTLEGQSRGFKHPGEGSAVHDIVITNAHAT